MYYVRDLYPNLSFMMGTKENTIPEQAELQHYKKVDTPQGQEVQQKNPPTLYFLWIAVAIVLLILFMNL